jgi:aspartyl-tRNA(Asn)/glutamyl-tRNA(Gln) amidotransferase subunit A
VRGEAALAEAKLADEARAAGRARSRLHGLPIAIKDIFASPDFETTCGSRILGGFRAPYEATALRRLREAGLIVIGSSNMDEFAMGGSTENSAWQKTRNPWDLARVPGGSSGGSAAAVAARLVPAALGSDTGGSIRQPAALWCHRASPRTGASRATGWSRSRARSIRSARSRVPARTPRFCSA